MRKTRNTELAHYTNYPLCGFCINAWDVVYARSRSMLSPMRWLEFCRWGGCDPDIWDFIDEETGWPHRWKVGHDGMPVNYRKHGTIFTVPDYDNKVFHRRDDDGPHAPWRANSNRLRKEASEKLAKRRGISLDEIAWDDDDPEEVVAKSDLLDQDIW